MNVSILIFMEHLLQQNVDGWDITVPVGFNPYFYGTSTSTKGGKIIEYT